MSQSLKALAKSMGGLPDSYLCIDTETTGFDGRDDLIWNVGTCLVIDGCPVERWERNLNWADHKFVDRRWLEGRVAWTSKQMTDAGRTCHMSISRMQEGIPPEVALEELADKLQAAKANNLPLLGHGFIKFDAIRICRHLQEWIGLRWRFSPELIIDTGAVEKAIETGWPPKANESFYEFSKRVLNRPSSHKWNLDQHCLTKYDLVQRYDLDEAFLHTAGADAYVCHLLLETYRQILADWEKQNAGEPAPSGTGRLDSTAKRSTGGPVIRPKIRLPPRG
jgi:hypothetical protein